MTLNPIPSEFSYIWGNFFFFFISAPFTGSWPSGKISITSPPLPTKDFSSKNKVSENWTERGREGFRSSEKSDRKGEKDQHFYLKGTVQKDWIWELEHLTFNSRPWIIKIGFNVLNHFITKSMYSPISLKDGLHKKLMAGSNLFIKKSPKSAAQPWSKLIRRLQDVKWTQIDSRVGYVYFKYSIRT